MNLDRRSFFKVGAGTAVVSVVMNAELAFSEESEAETMTVETMTEATEGEGSNSSIPLDELPSDPSLEDFQDFADQELGDMPDPEGMLINSEIASEPAVTEAEE